MVVEKTKWTSIFLSNDNTRYSDEYADDDDTIKTYFMNIDLDDEKNEILNGMSNPFDRNDNGRKSMATMKFLNKGGKHNTYDLDPDWGDTSYRHNDEQWGDIWNSVGGNAKNKRDERSAKMNTNRMMKAADKHPLHRKGSLNRAFDEE